MQTISWSGLEEVELRVGRIVGATRSPQRASRAACCRWTSARKSLVNFPKKQVGPLKSECLVTGLHDEEGHVALCVPDRDVLLGTRLS